nr:hypothetical protein [uncultured Nitrososphaera sp.]
MTNCAKCGREIEANQPYTKVPTYYFGEDGDEYQGMDRVAHTKCVFGF